MAPPSPKEFIETALFATNPYALSYSDSEQKWLILRHLLSLLQEYPSFRPSTGRFLHNDGNEVNLLCASGYVHVSNSTPSIPLTIWLHENYPHKAPLVFVSLDPMTPIHRHHPFVDTSGATTPPYILTWKYPPCNLSDLLHNLVQLFSHDHPFSYSPPTSSFTHPSLVSRKEALDRLVGMLYYDMVALQASTVEEIEELSLLQDNLKKRDRFTTSMILEMEQEWMKLKERSNNWAEEADRLVNWLKVNDRRPLMALAAGDVEIEDAFEIDEKSRVKLDCSAADSAIDDVLYKLDKALELEAVSFDSYIKQVRSLAREQFFLRASEMN
ncbi:PREDICTED: protein ELC-like [Theobroma cacao]|uniref:Protein ELC-like n=1 Tax=Theobroma cacao TaxID=3641 RepID=A0AB32VQU8_THECC|nr:PREDICTED: protein ELC-like [Theobroma cacao]